MADQARRGQESLYCHACHRQWQREGESIECPACMSASTEVITLENDPRHFHSRPPEQAAASAADAAAVAQNAHQTVGVQRSDGAAVPSAAPHASSSGTHNSSNAADSTSGQPLRFTTRFAIADVPQITFFTFVTGHVPPTPAENPPPVTYLRVHFLPPQFHGSPPAPPRAQNSSTQAGTDGTAWPSQQFDSQAQQQQEPPQAGPQPAATPGQHTMRADVFAAILVSLFNPANAVVGDAVYSQEALDRIVTQLREQMQPGGAPPASQVALDRLQTRELDDKMLGDCCDGKAKCVICVDDMVKGEKAAVLPCSHFFHGECVTPWLKQHNTCPVCRRSVEAEEEAKPVKPADVGVAPPEPAGRNEVADSMDCS